MPDRCFCLGADSTGRAVEGRGVEVVQALLREGLISSADLEPLASSSFYSGVSTGGLWTGGVFVGLVLVGLIINGLCFLLERSRVSRFPGDEQDDQGLGAVPRGCPVDLGVGPRRHRRLFRLRPQPHTPP